jgi:methylenetetrahydrofolate dehydrogenase (NADP+)/methenyltetrahydrofolate cyclohydrolase
MRIFHHYNITISGKHVVVVGRSNIVGRPISILTSLKQANSNGTTTICHSGTDNIGHYTKQADIIILAMGSPGYLKGDHIKEGAIVIDVGINRVTDNSPKGYKLVGDGDQLSLYEKVSAITPVPEGVGPMTIAMLVENTVEAAERTQV